MSQAVGDQIARIPGVGQTRQIGSEYAMRIWLDADKLHGYGMSATTALNAVKAQNVQIAAGQIGAEPAPAGNGFTAPVIAEGRFTTPEQFENIILRTNSDGTSVRLKDVARITLGPFSYGLRSTFDGKGVAGSRRAADQRRERAEGARSSDRQAGGTEADLPSRRQLQAAIRHHRFHQDLDQGSRRDAGDRDRARFHRHADVPAEPARDDHRHPGDPRRLDGRFPVDVRGRLLDQPADPVRHGAGDRHRRRRRHRRDRKRRTHHERGRPVAEGSHAQGDGTNFRRGRRDRPGADGGVHSERDAVRLGRRDLQAVRADDRVVDRVLRLPRLGVHAGAVRHADQTGSTSTGRRTSSSAASTACSTG